MEQFLAVAVVVTPQTVLRGQVQMLLRGRGPVQTSATLFTLVTGERVTRLTQLYRVSWGSQQLALVELVARRVCLVGHQVRVLYFFQVELRRVLIKPIALRLLLGRLGLELEAAGKPPLCMVVVVAGVTELEGADLWW
jgi:hypothetical protein